MIRIIKISSNNFVVLSDIPGKSTVFQSKVFMLRLTSEPKNRCLIQGPRSLTCRANSKALGKWGKDLVARHLGHG